MNNKKIKENRATVKTFFFIMTEPIIFACK